MALWARAVAAAWCCYAPSATAARSSGLRGGGASDPGDIPGWAGPQWFGRTFDDSPAAWNAWKKPREIPEAMGGDMEPVAPLDRMDQTWLDSLSGAAPLAPEERADTSRGYTAPMKPDWVPPHHRPRTFPGDEGLAAASEADSPTLPLAEKHVVHKMDRLRPRMGTWDWFRSRVVDPSPNYPLTAPGDTLPGELASAADSVPEGMRRYFEQIQDRKARLEAFKRQAGAFNASDKDQDAGISPQEFQAAVMEGQNKSSEEADRLWDKFHTSRGTNMGKTEFGRLAAAGFDLGTINRTDVSRVLIPEGIEPQGFWGSGAACPSGQHVSGVRLKVMPPTASADNTGLNGVGLQCSDGTEVSSIEGPDGTWSEWKPCGEGQRVYGFRVQHAASVPGGDNAGITGLEFACRTPDLSTFSTLNFNSDGAAGQVGVVSAGWSRDMMCSPREAVCGLQANVLRDQGEGDDMGITDVRVYCCDAKVDCSRACHDADFSMPCAVCRQVMG